MERMLLFAYQQSSLAVIIIFVGVKFVLKFGTDEGKWKILHPYLSSLPLSQLLLSIILDTRVTESEKVQSNAIVFWRPLPYY